MRESAEESFQTYGNPPTKITSFKYLRWVLTSADDEWPDVVGNLKKAQKSWVLMARILGREDAISQVSGMFFKAMVQDFLLFGSETWLMTPHMVRAMRSFQNRVSRRITGGGSEATGGWGM